MSHYSIREIPGLSYMNDPLKIRMIQDNKGIANRHDHILVDASMTNMAVSCLQSLDAYLQNVSR